MIASIISSSWVGVSCVRAALQESLHAGREWLSKRFLSFDELFASWQAFWEVLEGISIWNWKAYYNNPHMVDRTSWGVPIDYDGRKLESRALNAYP